MLLLANDFWAKATYHNWLTGKLSDFAGIAMLSLLLFSFFPRGKKGICYLLVIAFTAWKSPLVTPLLDAWNALPFIDFARVIDYSDLLALIVLIPIYKYHARSSSFYPSIQKLALPALLSVSFFACIATSQIRPIFTNYVELNHKVTLGLTVDEFLQQLEQDRYSIEHDSLYLNEFEARHEWAFHHTGFAYDSTYNNTKESLYRINNIVIESDTIKELYFSMKAKNKCVQLDLHHAIISQSYSLTNRNKYLRKLKKRYRVNIRKYLRDKY